MRAWRDRDGPGPDRDDRGLDPATLDELERRGIDLDPIPPGSHRHGDLVHEDGHSHPHVEAVDGRPIIGIVGAGAVGMALGLAFSRAGWTVGAVASRDAARRNRFRSLVPGARAFADPLPMLDECHLVVLAVPDDAIAGVAVELHLYSGQAVVHTSGLLGAGVLAPAMAAGTQAGSFHPLVAFADPERAVAALVGATIAIEGDESLLGLLAELAEAIGGVPVRLAPGTKPAYHAAAVLAAGGFVALLDAIAELGRAVGLDEAGALAVYGPLITQTLANASTLGIRASLTGPITRGDTGTIAAHLRALNAFAPDVVELYLAAARREVTLAVERGALTPEGGERVRASLANHP